MELDRKAKAGLVLEVLKRLKAGNLDSFNQRLRNQKIQYIAQSVGLTPAYKYNLYIRGPYSPYLTKDLYWLSQNSLYEKLGYVANELDQKLKRLREVITGKSVRELELATTLHWLLESGNKSLKSSTDKLKFWKEASNQEIAAAKKLMEDWKNVE